MGIDCPASAEWCQSQGTPLSGQIDQASKRIRFQVYIKRQAIGPRLRDKIQRDRALSSITSASPSSAPRGDKCRADDLGASFADTPGKGERHMDLFTVQPGTRAITQDDRRPGSHGNQVDR